MPRPSVCAAWLPCLDTLSPGLPCVGANKPPEHTLRWTCLISWMPTRLAWALKGWGRPGGCGPCSVSHLGCHILQRLARATQEKGLFVWEAGLGSEGLVFWDGPTRGSRCHGKCHQQVPRRTEVPQSRRAPEIHGLLVTVAWPGQGTSPHGASAHSHVAFDLTCCIYFIY